ncbi:hypothetical protein PIB30_091863 [Stylosanthes scabra]|uniref:PiggyBac transposable element-derived protein domain-containing protein n=1 Tax=Stylosanthes scabra TaxID=79078 RepID=A0ABU6UU62_9FABA|nr:hypothetical protein [Stylosanthes scabra]
MHGFNGAKYLNSVWCEHYPFAIVADEYFQSKANLDLLDKTGKVATARYLHVKTARLMCINRGLEVQVLEEETSQKRKKENELLKDENGELKNKVATLGKDKKDLESRVFELCVEKKEA